MAILTPYKVNSYRRICDICGRPRQIEDIRFSDNVAICRIHPEFRTAQQLNRINARVRAPRLLPVPQPKPFAPVDTWTAEESELFNFIVATAPFDTVNVASNAGAIVGVRSYQAYGWAILYLTAVLAENRRPRAWLDQALTKATALGVELRTFQTPVTLNGSRSGGFSLRTLNASAANNFVANDNALACAAFCRLYTATGDPTFLGAARDAAHFLANLHAVNIYVSSPGVTYRGALPQVLTGGVVTDDYYPGDLLGLWALTLVQGLLGDITIGQTNNGGGTFTAAPARPISEIIAAIRAFWTDGVDGVNGLSAETPFEYFHGATNTWTSTLLTSANWAPALFALTEVDGVSAQVAALWDYLMTYTTDTAVGDGTYDPLLALAGNLEASTAKNASKFYEWGAAGLLAKITTARSRASIKRAKDVLAERRQRYDTPHLPKSEETLALGLLGRSTLEFEPITSILGGRLQSVVRAAQTGLIYRQLPQGYIGRGH